METTFKQEMPPKGGYGPIDYKRAMPKRGPSGYILLGGVAACVLYGMTRAAQTNIKRRKFQWEEREARISIYPLMEAEKDRDTLNLLKFNQQQESLIMKDVPGWQVGESSYHINRWIEPHIEELYFLDKDVKWYKTHGYATYV